jgi:predicted oxidoreductase
MTPTKLPTAPIGHTGEQVSAIALGCMGLAGTWNPAEYTSAHRDRAFLALDTAIEEGITFYDHADIYGNRLCEQVFGEYLTANPGVREKLFIASKCGILFADEDGPQRYNLSQSYILNSLEGSLKRLQVEQIDLYQLHRPDPYTHPRETAHTLNQIVREGRVRYVGVSNYSASQIFALQAYIDVPIVSTQPAISLWNLEAMDNGVLDQCLEQNMRPLAYSPLGGGVLTGRNWEQHDKDARVQTLKEAFDKFGDKYDATPSQLSLAWLMHHPARIIPLLGSNRPENIRDGADATRIELSREDWYSLWVTGRGVVLP